MLSEQVLWLIWGPVAVLLLLDRRTLAGPYVKPVKRPWFDNPVLEGPGMSNKRTSQMASGLVGTYLANTFRVADHLEGRLVDCPVES